MSVSTLEALVHTIRHEANGVISVELRPAKADTVFPPFSAGSHIDLHLPNGLVRSYSLSNPCSDEGRYVVGVLNEPNSRGGSRYVHEQLRVGSTITISAPRNNFKLEEDAPHTVLLAGGIGVTPIWCMLQRLVKLDRSVELIYCARSEKEAAFTQAIKDLAGDKVKLTWHFDEEVGTHPDLSALLAGRDEGTYFYCCGPTPMLDNFEATCEVLGYENARIERFAAVEITEPQPEGSYTVECRSSNKTFTINAGESILDVLNDAGMDLPHSCREGICGACETKVIEGEIQHRDGILSKREREAGNVMMICVSGCAGDHLVLDI